VRKAVQILFVLLTLILLLFVMIPFLIPIPPLENTVPPEALADPDSRFIELEGVHVHCKRYGEGDPLIFLLHGFAESTLSWREVVEPLSDNGAVVAFDRPSFCSTERPIPGSWQCRSLYSTDAQVDLTLSFIKAMGVDHAILIGHSTTGATA
jgi:pimeloyl-ACP methyl ester carboxylesterase